MKHQVHRVLLSVGTVASVADGESAAVVGVIVVVVIDADAAEFVVVVATVADVFVVVATSAAEFVVAVAYSCSL